MDCRSVIRRHSSDGFTVIECEVSKERNCALILITGSFMTCEKLNKSKSNESIPIISLICNYLYFHHNY